MRVLVVSDIYTHPHNQGNLQGVYRECLKMKEMGWEIDFLYWGKFGRANLTEMELFFGEDHFFYVNISYLKFSYHLRNYIRREMDKKGITKCISLPYAPDELYYEEIKEKVCILHNQRHYDVIWLEYYLQSKLFDYIDKSVVKVIHTHDMFSNRQRIFQKDGKIPEFYYLTRRGERKALARADVVIAVQDTERDRFESLLKGTDTICLTVGNLIEKREAEFIHNSSYGFFGSINDANITAVETFIEKVLPAIKKKNPNSHFVIAGGVCKKIPDSDEYQKIGYVRTLEEFYNRISFVVTPMLAGTGLNIKNIEALSFFKPIVTTNIGAKGLAGAEESMIVTDVEGFDDAIIKLLGDKDLLARMSRASRDYIEKYNRKQEDGYKMIENMVRGRKVEDNNNTIVYS